MKKIIAVLVCGLICVAAIVSSVVCSSRADYAKEHYENNYFRDPKDVIRVTYGYGCGDNDCEYCNGGQYKKSLDDFVFVNLMNRLNTASTVVAVIFGIATLGLGVCALQPNNTDAEKAEE